MLDGALANALAALEVDAQGAHFQWCGVYKMALVGSARLLRHLAATLGEQAQPLLRTTAGEKALASLLQVTASSAGASCAVTRGMALLRGGLVSQCAKEKANALFKLCASLNQGMLWAKVFHAVFPASSAETLGTPRRHEHEESFLTNALDISRLSNLGIAGPEKEV